MYFIFQIPITIADNAGYDSAELVSQLRAAHAGGKKESGLGKISTFMLSKVSLINYKVCLLVLI